MAYIDISLDEFSDEELLEELEQRGVSCDPRLLEIYTAMHQGKQEEAWELMKRYVCDKTGRVI